MTTARKQFLWFRVPALPTKEYHQLRDLKTRLEAADQEIVRLGIQALVELINTPAQEQKLRALLRQLRMGGESQSG